jgi:L-2-hydroxyglutarate oxidase LhgO
VAAGFKLFLTDNKRTYLTGMDAEITIIGAGIVGLAIAERFSSSYNNVFLIEKHSSFGQETSSRNSEVIHAGIYYPKGSLKSSLCLEGKTLLYNYCMKYEIPFNNCGKLIVATTQKEVPVIEEISRNAMNNGLTDLVILEKEQIASLEPNIFAIKALYSPSTGIVDSHSLMKRFETNTINNNGNIVYNSEVRAIKKIRNGYEVELLDADKRSFSFTTRILINSGGLNADKVSEMTGIIDKSLIIHFCKGEYFRLRPPKNRLIARLIYPLPHTNLEGTGIHVTIDMGGGVKLGPDVTWINSKDYDFTVDPGKRDSFFNSAKKFLPFLEKEDIVPEMAGIRPKIQGSGDLVRDFYIKEESARNLPGFINLIGIESPGLTSSLAIANYVRRLVD